MYLRNHLLFTSNIYISKIEIAFLGGRIVQQFSRNVFIASLPTSIKKSWFFYSQIEKPDSLELEKSVLAEIKTWISLDQTLITL